MTNSYLPYIQNNYYNLCAKCHHQLVQMVVSYIRTRMWANAQRDGRPAEYR